jgi:2-methylcitrate dehydratase PrpD
MTTGSTPTGLTTTGPTRRIAEFAGDLEYRHLPAQVQGALQAFLLDYLRVASVGERMGWSDWARTYAQQTAAPGHAPVLFASAPVDPVSAAFMNTVYAGSLDADDVHVGAMLHPGCIVFSAALAVGQAHHLPGSRVLAAVAAGYEAMIRIALAIQPSHFKRGFQSTSTCGVFGAAVAASALLSNGPQRATRIAEAIGLGASFCGGLTQFYHSGSTVKRIHAAQAASSGVRAAMLVDSGFSGPTDILEGQDGFARAYADAVDFDRISDDLGHDFRLLEVAIKPHACSARVQSAIEAASTVCRDHTIAAGRVRRIRLGIPRVIQGRLTSNRPGDLQAAQMSAPFSVALALHKQGGPGAALNVDDFEAGLADTTVMALAAKVECVVDEEVERTSTSESVSARVTVMLDDGNEFSTFVLAPKGSASRPFSMADHEARARAELGRRYQVGKLDPLMTALDNFADMEDVSELSKHLA